MLAIWGTVILSTNDLSILQDQVPFFYMVFMIYYFFGALPTVAVIVFVALICLFATFFGIFNLCFGHRQSVQDFNKTLVNEARRKSMVISLLIQRNYKKEF